MQGQHDQFSWLSQARAWCEADPDPETAGSMRSMIEAEDESALASCFVPPLEFGTAGLRGVAGPGPARMNLAVIRRVTRALASVVEEHRSRVDKPAEHAPGPIVLGFDGRVDSQRFAREAVGVLAEAGARVAYFAHPVPTPLVAFAAQRLEAPAAIVVTASHNPKEYNGYKVYGDEAIQIVPPFDAEVEEQVRALGGARDIRCSTVAFDGVLTQAQPVQASISDGYVQTVLSARVAGAKAGPVRIAYTPLHGVGGAWVERVFKLAGYADLHVEPSQRDIDGRFPSLIFPNPEEPATLELGLRLAASIDADLLLVNDPDADRMGAAIRIALGQYRILSGNEIGLILTDFVLAHAPAAQDRIVTSTVVSSPMVHRVAHHYGALSETTLTGFKWLWTAMRQLEARTGKQFALCWEEALGYSTHPGVRDKDGIAAALMVADWVSECKASGITPRARLAELYRSHGVWGSVPRSMIRSATTGVAEIQGMMRRLVEEPPRELIGRRVTSVQDFNYGATDRPPWLGASNMVLLEIDGGARIVVRPSGTEPKLKLYADVEETLRPAEDPLSAVERAKGVADALNAALACRLEAVE
ncbi:MAG TPA: phospho-sugar mutase [Polyangiaceae bacterium]|nr:phospho-sugar mutase [Polyangiaceae bacterium]